MQQAERNKWLEGSTSQDEGCGAVSNGESSDATVVEGDMAQRAGRSGAIDRVEVEVGDVHIPCAACHSTACEPP